MNTRLAQNQIGTHLETKGQYILTSNSSGQNINVALHTAGVNMQVQFMTLFLLHLSEFMGFRNLEITVESKWFGVLSADK